MNGALARANAAIRNAQPVRTDAGRQRARRALRLADHLLDQLEQLMLRGALTVPASARRLVDRLRRSTIQAGVDRPMLRADVGVPGLMDDVYELEAKLLRRSRRRLVAHGTRRLIAHGPTG